MILDVFIGNLPVFFVADVVERSELVFGVVLHEIYFFYHLVDEQGADNIQRTLVNPVGVGFPALLANYFPSLGVEENQKREQAVYIQRVHPEDTKSDEKVASYSPATLLPVPLGAPVIHVSFVGYGLTLTACGHCIVQVVGIQFALSLVDMQNVF